MTCGQFLENLKSRSRLKFTNHLGIIVFSLTYTDLENFTEVQPYSI